MNGRGNVVVTALTLVSLALFAFGCVACVFGDAAAGAAGAAQGCYFMAWAIYLEVYAHRE